MRRTDFASALYHYFGDFLVNDRGCSARTIETYRYAFIQFVDYMENVQGITPEKIELTHINAHNIQSFLLWLEHQKNVSIATRNQRLAAFKSFSSFLKYDFPEYLNNVIQIQNIKMKKNITKDVSYLKPEGVKLLLSQIDRSSYRGRRDYAMFSLLYATGIRVSELIKIRGRDISMSSPKHITIYGKGNKIRHVPIVQQLVPILKTHLEENHSLLPQNLDKPIFTNHSDEMFTRQGINHLLTKYANRARRIDSSLIPIDCSPHKIRHSTAMSMVENGTDLIVIRDFLGHSSVKTTEIYAKLSASRRIKAIEAASKEIVPSEEATWINNTSIKDWLKAMTHPKIM
ncbi:MAG: tyrosine-type recombinase/integrase [Oscillospiraceae bacterium]|nr:tyrosine-type recombinase/integrase [Oscillospiraceae bacterium]